MKKTICPYFLRNECKFGANCKYSHQIDDVHMPMNNHSPNQVSNILAKYLKQFPHSCKFFLQNNCSKNEKCSYFHGYCYRLKPVKTIVKHQNDIINLLNIDNSRYISSDDKAFYIRISGSDEFTENNISQEYKIGKLIYSSDKIICSIEKEGV